MEIISRERYLKKVESWIGKENVIVLATTPSRTFGSHSSGSVASNGNTAPRRVFGGGARR